MKPQVEDGLIEEKTRIPAGRLPQQPRDLKGPVLERTGSHSQTLVSESLWSLSNMQIPGPTPKFLTQQVYGGPEICNLNQLPRGRWPADFILRELLD